MTLDISVMFGLFWDFGKSETWNGPRVPSDVEPTRALEAPVLLAYPKKPLQQPSMARGYSSRRSHGCIALRRAWFVIVQELLA